MDRAGELAWSAFRSWTRPGKKFFDTLDQPTEDELIQWRTWMTTVFRPLHDQMQDLIVKHADLLLEDDFPESFALFSAHISAYRAIFRQWEQGNFTQHVSVVVYPRAQMSEYLAKSYKHLKAEQRRLMGTTEPK